MSTDEVAPPRAEPSHPGPEAVVLGGRYVLGERLGEGGMAQVRRARDTLLDREVAVKVFHSTVELPDGGRRRSGEVRLLTGLSHPHLVTLFDAGTDDSQSFGYLVMELVEGTTLAPWIPLPGELVATIGAQLADGLAYVHERGIIHRDLKPANVLLDRSGTNAKLADFGVARLVEATALTVHGTTVGTPNYLSPEQATGAPLTGASDVYSLGLVLLEALTGTKAFPGHGVGAAVARLHRDPELPDWLDPGWHQLIASMTARDPLERPRAAEVAARLRALGPTTSDAVGPTSLHGDEPTVVLPLAAEPRSRRAAWLAAACIAVIALTGTLIAVLGGGSSTPSSARPSYPAVGGQLGAHLAVLQDAVPAELRADVLSVTRAAAAGRVTAALAALTTLSRDLGAARVAGRITDARYGALAADIAVVGLDLRRIAPSASRAAPSAQPTAPSSTAPSSTASSSGAARAAANRTSAARTPAAPVRPGNGKNKTKPKGHGKNKP